MGNNEDRWFHVVVVLSAMLLVMAGMIPLMIMFMF